MEELKPCPFCGGEATIRGGRKCYWVRCTNCGCETTVRDSQEEVIEIWNRRAE